MRCRPDKVTAGLRPISSNVKKAELHHSGIERS